eukprot:TRINITY_DN17795_c0_g1_i1.p1 TRINITY_DN17795_c0_g1~~TRINITY_DN17795_c0_g1_i1.p1  ORF type:complete len:193 (-),score=40.68 TRINITY_DN17795_c0_g1_i1:744-1322(-)
MAKAKKAKRALDSFNIIGRSKQIKVGDVVLLRPPDHKTPPYVARVERIETDGANRTDLKVRWYYRPEDAAGGRRAFHGQKELFLSDHHDTVSAESVETKIKVHPFKDYIKLETVAQEDYFCRFEYKASKGTFSPDRVAVYCKCEMPYNPDDLMLQCEGCKDWFHPECVALNLSPEQIKKIDYQCNDCAERGR